MSKPIAKKHSLDVPHLTSIEYPLNVQNVERAIEMVGGKDKISKSIKNQVDHRLELRLRKDPFHHPIESLINMNENVLMKISVPKNNLPEDFDPDNYDLQEILQKSYTQNNNHIKFKAQPVAIINKNYSFKNMTDFQYNTKSNKLKTEIYDALYNGEFAKISEFTKKISDLSEETAEAPKNEDLQLPPPPLFSNVSIPYNYQYVKNPYSSEVLDSNGDVKLVNSRKHPKLHTIFIGFREEVPTQPSEELLTKLNEIQRLVEENKTYDRHHFNYQLVECIKWLDKIFNYKPVWVRKHIVDILPVSFRNIVKFALPYVSFVYKKGPWRQSYVRFGFNPLGDKNNYIYQTEAFRVMGHHFEMTDSSIKILPPSLQEYELNSDNIDFRCSYSLFFNGGNLPHTLLFQLGDISDPDVLELLDVPYEEKFNNACEFNYGWINPKIMKRIRKLMRYKFKQYIAEAPLDQKKIEKIFTEDVPDSEDEEKEDENENDNEDNEEDDDDDDDAPGTSEENATTEDNILRRLQKIDPEAAESIKGLVGLIKQEHLSSSK